MLKVREEYRKCEFSERVVKFRIVSNLPEANQEQPAPPVCTDCDADYNVGPGIGQKWEYEVCTEGPRCPELLGDICNYNRSPKATAFKAHHFGRCEY